MVRTSLICQWRKRYADREKRISRELVHTRFDLIIVNFGKKKIEFDWIIKLEKSERTDRIHSCFYVLFTSFIMIGCIKHESVY